MFHRSNHPLGLPKLADGPKSASPQRVSHPSKNSIHMQPFCVTTAVAFLTLPPTLVSEETHLVTAAFRAPRQQLREESLPFHSNHTGSTSVSLAIPNTFVAE
jgi:hypothetical protein